MQLSGEGWQRPLFSHACTRSRVSPSCADLKRLLLRPDLTLFFFFPKIKSILSSDLDVELPGLMADVVHPPNFRAMLKAQTVRRNTCSEGAFSSPTALLNCREQLLTSSGIHFASSGRETSPSSPAPASFQSRLQSSGTGLICLLGSPLPSSYPVPSCCRSNPCHVQGAELSPFVPD